MNCKVGFIAEESVPTRQRLFEGYFECLGLFFLSSCHSLFVASKDKEEGGGSRVLWTEGGVHIP